MQIINKEEYNNIPISSLNFSTRAFNALMHANITTLYLLIENIDGLDQISNMGAKSITEIMDTLNRIALDGVCPSNQSANIDDISLMPSILCRPSTDLKVSVRICNFFRRKGIETIGQVVALSESEIMHMRNMGSLSAQQVLEEISKLQALGEDYFIADSKYSIRELDIATVKKLQESYGIMKCAIEIEGVEDRDYGAYDAFRIVYNDKESYIQQVEFDVDYDDLDEEDTFVEYEIQEEEALEQLTTSTKQSLIEYINLFDVKEVDEGAAEEYGDKITDIFKKYEIPYADLISCH